MNTRYIAGSTYITHAKENFSFGYFHSLVAAAGFGYSIPNNDNDSVDIQINGKIQGSKFHNQCIGVQLKASSAININLENEIFKFELKKKNYNDLCNSKVIFPKILVILRLPQDQDCWLYSNQNYCLLNYGMYWCDLRGFTKTDNDSKSIDVNTNNVFNIETIRNMMSNVANTGDIQ